MRIRYDWVAVMVPLLLVSAVLVYQKAALGGFWRSLNVEDDAGRVAGAMMGYAQGLQVLWALVLGSLVGLGLAVRWMLSRRPEKTIAVLALFINGLPLAIVVVFVVRNWLAS